MNKKHGMANHRLYGTWKMMMQRCYNPNHNAYRYYGERGIIVCKRWHNIANFINDMYSTFQEGLTLDRENNNKGYSKSNCRWANLKTQQRNKSILENNKTGYIGVSYVANRNKWNAMITLNKKSINLGNYNTPTEAAKARDKYISDNNLEHTKNF